MGLTQEFRENLEHEMFMPISRRGLDSFAQKAYEDFIEKLGIDDTRIIHNAFHLNLAAQLEQHNAAINPDKIIAFMEKTTLRSTKTLHDYAPDFLKSQGHSGNISNDLYAASITSPILNSETPGGKYIGIVGSEAFKFANQSNKISKRVSRFQKEAIPIEAKVLHLTHIVRRMDSAIRVIDNEVEKIHSIPPKVHQATLEILDHTEDLCLKPERSPLEDMIQRKYNILQETLENTPINDRDNVFQISNTLSH